MIHVARLLSITFLAIGCLAAPAIAKDNDPDIDGICLAQSALCHSTCDLRFPGDGFSAQLSRDLCYSDCNKKLFECSNPDGNSIARQNSRSQNAIEKLKRGNLPTLSQ